jgi:hypothetical protein
MIPEAQAPAGYLASASRVAVVSGAGVSTGSGSIHALFTQNGDAGLADDDIAALKIDANCEDVLAHVSDHRA